MNPEENSSWAKPVQLALSIREVMKITGLGRSFIYEEIKAGRLVVKKAGRRSLIFVADLNAWLARLPEMRSANSKLEPNTP
jgi:excisionase family DNA binding protein